MRPQKIRYAPAESEKAMGFGNVPALGTLVRHHRSSFQCAMCSSSWPAPGTAAMTPAAPSEWAEKLTNSPGRSPFCGSPQNPSRRLATDKLSAVRPAWPELQTARTSPVAVVTARASAGELAVELRSTRRGLHVVPPSVD